MTEVEERIRSAIIQVLGVDITKQKKSRKRVVVGARHIYAYLAYKHQCQRSKVDIAETIGKDHSTIIHSEKTVMNLMQTEKDFKNAVEEIERKLNNVSEDVIKHLNLTLGVGKNV